MRSYSVKLHKIALFIIWADAIATEFLDSTAQFVEVVHTDYEFFAWIARTSLEEKTFQQAKQQLASQSVSLRREVVLKKMVSLDVVYCTNEPLLYIYVLLHMNIPIHNSWWKVSPIGFVLSPIVLAFFFTVLTDSNY